MIVENVPDEIREGVDSLSGATGASINSTVVGILARRYGVPFAASGYPRLHAARSGTWVLRMPAELRDLIAEHAAARRGDSRRGLILLALAEELDLPPVSPRRLLAA